MNTGEARWAKRYKAKRKEQIFALLGRCCCRCGFSDERALQIDHVYGGGNKERRRKPSWSRRYLDVVENPGDYQLLCANCNWIKRSGNSDELGGRAAHANYVRVITEPNTKWSEEALQIFLDDAERRARLEIDLMRQP